MRQFLRASSGQTAPLAPARGGSDASTSLGGIQLFETLVGEVHSAALRTAAIASCTNALASGRALKSPQMLNGLMPEQPTVLGQLPRCQNELRLQEKALAAVTRFFGSLGFAQAGVAAFCHDAEQWGAEQAAFLHLKDLSSVWRRVSHLALGAVVTLNADVERCLPALYGQNTAVLKKLLADVLCGGHPCLDSNGHPYLPELPQRRPAPRRVVNKPCVVEHQGKAARAIIKDVSASGLGLEGGPTLTTEKVALVEIEGGRCFAGIVVWAKGASAGIKFDTPLSPSDPLLIGRN